MALYESTYERVEHDCYETPTWVTEALLPHLGRGRLKIWEPCAGSGTMSEVLATRHDVFSSDLYPGAEDIIKLDFLHPESDIFSIFRYDLIVTNPPFGREGPRFVRRALELTRQHDALTAMLLPMNWDTAATRRDLFADCSAFKCKIVLTKRIVWFQKEGGGEAPKENHAWYLWDQPQHGAPTIRYWP